jgi:hypothetical protein
MNSNSKANGPMNWETFNLAFWHPFGWHGRESPQDILRRKRLETEENGWTLWSFRYRPMMNNWYHELSSVEPGPVFVFCSQWEGGRDPGGPETTNTTLDCTHYQFVGGDKRWQPLPSLIRVPHPFPFGGRLASAFVVATVHYPLQPFPRPGVEWFSKTKGPWRREIVIRSTMHSYPTRGEYLLRRGGTNLLRQVSAILELKPPYLACVAIERPK